MSAITLDLTGAFWDLTDPIVFTLVQTAAVDFEAIDTPQRDIYFDGMLQPMKPRDLLIKPEGERKWKWWMLFTEQELQPGNILQDESGSSYRVMSTVRWDLAGYRGYEIIQAPFPPFAGA